MHDSIGIITLPIYHHRLISFPSKKGAFPTIAETFYKIEQPLHPLPQCLAC